MILKIEDIQSIIQKNPNKALIAKGRAANKELRMHLYGENMESHLEQIKGFEQPSLRQLRVKWARSNQDFMARLGRPIDKVFSAKGGSLHMNLPAAKEKAAKGLLMDVDDGYSVNKWIENFWTPHYKDDPNGIIFMEIEEAQEALKLKSQGKSFVYPTYKSINCIYDYKPCGNSFEYIVFTVSKEEKAEAGLSPDDIIYRVVDEAMDYFIKWDGQQVQILNQLSFPNLFGTVPAITMSDTPDPSCDGLMLSPFNDVVKLANEFLLYGSIRMTHNFMHGFPKYWQYAQSCNTCNGTLFVGAKDCPDCKGTGKQLMLKVTDSMILSNPTDKDTPLIAPNVAGYVSPDKIYWEISTNDLSDLENIATYTLWATTSKVKTQGMALTDKGTAKTATEVMDEIKPQADRLWPISDMAAKRVKFIIDAVIKVQIDLNYKGCSVAKGKRYMIEGPDALLTRYQDGIKAGLNDEMLDIIYQQYIEAEYQSDEVKLYIETKKFRIKPLFHYKPSELDASMFVTDVDKAANRYFSDFVKERLNDAMLLSMSEEQLRIMLAEYAKAKQAAFPKPEPVVKPAFN